MHRSSSLDRMDVFLRGHEKRHGGCGKCLRDKRKSRAGDSLPPGDLVRPEGTVHSATAPGELLNIFVFCSEKYQKKPYRSLQKRVISEGRAVSGSSPRGNVSADGRTAAPRSGYGQPRTRRRRCDVYRTPLGRGSLRGLWETSVMNLNRAAV